MPRVVRVRRRFYPKCDGDVVLAPSDSLSGVHARKRAHGVEVGLNVLHQIRCPRRVLLEQGETRGELVVQTLLLLRRVHDGRLVVGLRRFGLRLRRIQIGGSLLRNAYSQSPAAALHRRQHTAVVLPNQARSGFAGPITTTSRRVDALLPD